MNEGYIPNVSPDGYFSDDDHLLLGFTLKGWVFTDPINSLFCEYGGCVIKSSLS